MFPWNKKPKKTMIEVNFKYGSVVLPESTKIIDGKVDGWTSHKVVITISDCVNELEEISRVLRSGETVKMTVYEDDVKKYRAFFDCFMPGVDDFMNTLSLQFIEFKEAS